MAKKEIIMQMKIGGVPYATLVQVATEIAGRCIALPNRPNPAYTGGHISFMDTRHSVRNIYTFGFGDCSTQWSEETYTFVQEKVTRLLHNIPNGHFSAWQSRDYDNKEYGGAIIQPDDSFGLEIGASVIGGCSGLKEHEDEAIIIVNGLTFRWLTYGDAEQIVAISNNMLFSPLYQACADLYDRYAGSAASF